jgi:hypothetical protein
MPRKWQPPASFNLISTLIVFAASIVLAHSKPGTTMGTHPGHATAVFVFTRCRSHPKYRAPLSHSMSAIISSSIDAIFSSRSTRVPTRTSSWKRRASLDKQGKGELPRCGCSA